MPSLRELALLAEAAYTERECVGRWSRLHTYGRRSAAFHAVLWGCEGKGVFAVRGTANLRSAYADLKLLLGSEPVAWRAGLSALADASRRVSEGPLLTGHSLGGAFASALAVDASLRAVCFNAPGMRKVLPELAARVTAGSILNVCCAVDWIRLLSGPGLGIDRNFTSGRLESDVPPGPLGILEASRRLRLPGETWLQFALRSLEAHSISTLLGSCSLDLSVCDDEACSLRTLSMSA